MSLFIQFCKIIIMATTTPKIFDICLFLLLVKNRASHADQFAPILFNHNPNSNSRKFNSHSDDGNQSRRLLQLKGQYYQ